MRPNSRPFEAGAEMLLVVTPRGYEYVYIRGEGRMVLVHEGDASYEVAPSTAEEYVELEGRSWRQAQADRLNPPEYVMQQEESGAMIEVSGIMRIYAREVFVRGTDQPLWVYEFSETPERFEILGKSRLNHSVILIKMYGQARYWIDLEDQDSKFEILGEDLEYIPIVDQTGKPILTSEQVSVISMPDSTAAPAATEYVLQSFVVDESVNEPLDIELTWYGAKWVDSSKVGLLSRDFNPHGNTNEFQLRSPVIGPDVRVEIVSKEGKNDKKLGNYVVISFPASVYQENAEIMQRLADDPKHNPSEWREGGRIFIGFAHLSVIEKHIQPEAILDTVTNSMIGRTGNTGWQQDYITHLDLSLAYFGPTRWNKTGFADAEDFMAKERTKVNRYMVFPIRSNLNPRGTSASVYGENLDPVRVWPELDEFEQAKNEKGESIYP